jgi:hypothetical protein
MYSVLNFNEISSSSEKKVEFSYGAKISYQASKLGGKSQNASTNKSTGGRAGGEDTGRQDGPPRMLTGKRPRPASVGRRVLTTIKRGRGWEPAARGSNN